MPQRCSLYLGHRGMSLHPFVKGLGRLAHFLVEKKLKLAGLLRNDFNNLHYGSFVHRAVGEKNTMYNG